MELLLLKSTEVVQSLKPPHAKIPENVLKLVHLQIISSQDKCSLLKYSLEHGDIIMYICVYRYLEILNFYFKAFDVVYEKNLKIKLLTYL